MSAVTPTNAATVAGPSSRVSTFELFFDLVFVLTIARVGLVLHDDRSGRSRRHVPHRRQRLVDVRRLRLATPPIDPARPFVLPSNTCADSGTWASPPESAI